MRTVRHIVPALAGLCLLAAASPARAQLTCGGTVGPGGTFVLTEDLDCRADPDCAFPKRCSPALTVVGNAVLNMNGHTLTCSSGQDDGVLLSGTGAVVRDGGVNICGTGVRVAGEGRHVVRNMVSARSASNGFTVLSDDNALEDSIAHTSGSNGFNLSGASDNSLVRNVATGTERFNGFNVSERNRIRDNVATANGVNGFNVNSDANKLIQNSSVGNGGRGFDVGGDGNMLRSNRAAANDVGIKALGAGNVIERSVALDNASGDLAELGTSCDDAWRRNVFGTSNAPGCIR